MEALDRTFKILAWTALVQLNGRQPSVGSLLLLFGSVTLWFEPWTVLIRYSQIVLMSDFLEYAHNTTISFENKSLEGL